LAVFYPKALVHLVWWPYETSIKDLNELNAAFEKPTSAGASPESRIDQALSQLVGLGGVEPRSVRVEHNDVFTADTFSVSLDEYLFRIDPRDVRAMMVDVRMGATASAKDRLSTDDDLHRQIYGHVDKPYSDYSTDGASTIVLEGRDYTGLLLDEKWQGRRIELGRPLLEILGEIVESVPALTPLELILHPGLKDPIIPKGARRREHYFTASPDSTLWEGLLELTMRVGLMLVVEVDKLVVQPPRNLVTDQDAVPLFIEGRNLKQLKIERNLGTADLPSVQIAAHDRKNKRVIKGTWPPERKVARLTKGKRSETTTTQRFFVKIGEPTEQKLIEIAKRVFAFYARQQLEVSFSTHELEIELSELGEQFNRRGVHRSIPSTAIRNGSAVAVRLEPEVRNMLVRGYSPRKSARELRAMGYEPQVADMLARSWRPIEHRLFVSSATQMYQDGVYSLDVSAQNFIEVG
tara:strand:+ start:440 stop:1831 length:1392 start_codon:yes stop_codon:yes gene_type:complete